MCVFSELPFNMHCRYTVQSLLRLPPLQQNGVSASGLVQATGFHDAIFGVQILKGLFVVQSWTSYPTNSSYTTSIQIILTRLSVCSRDCRTTTALS